MPSCATRAPSWRTRELAALSGLALVLAILAPSAALACPSCAMRPRGGLTETLSILALLLLPFALAGLFTWAVKRESSSCREG